MTDRLLAGIRFVESGLLVLLLSSMILLAAYQVIARNFFDTGILWGDSLVRVLVLWVTFIGATIASRNDEHIRIDLLTRFTGERSSLWLDRFRSLFTAFIAGVFTWYSYEFVRLDYEDGIIAFASVPAWVCELVMPIGAGLICLRYLIRALTIR
ncbi:MAG: TRAP transporter small permease [Gammaproteobacteria bacterium]|nr:MAG: TRAP transporter small permease [Gammaproteobacteria bacterium]